MLLQVVDDLLGLVELVPALRRGALAVREQHALLLIRRQQPKRRLLVVVQVHFVLKTIISSFCPISFNYGSITNMLSNFSSSSAGLSEFILISCAFSSSSKSPKSVSDTGLDIDCEFGLEEDPPFFEFGLNHDSNWKQLIINLRT